MRDELMYLAATTALNLVAIMNFRIPDERLNVLLLILPTFFAVVIGIPLWLYLTSEVSVLAGVCAVDTVPPVSRSSACCRLTGASG